MRVNARKEEFEHVELFGKPALYTSSRIDRSTVPKGFYCYDLRGSDYDPGKPVTLENWVVANHAGTVVTAKPITIPKSGAKQLSGKLNFLGESLTLAGFCGEHGLELPHDNRKFIPRPALPEEAGLFFALPEEQDAALGAIGHIRIDFGRGGDEFWHTWHPRGDEELNSPAFKAELTEVMNELREFGPLGNLAAMYRYCGEHDGKIEGGWRQNYGYFVETEHYRYCLRCSPGQGDYHAYDNDLITFLKLPGNSKTIDQAVAEVEAATKEECAFVTADCVIPQLTEMISDVLDDVKLDLVGELATQLQKLDDSGGIPTLKAMLESAPRDTSLEDVLDLAYQAGEFRLLREVGSPADYAKAELAKCDIPLKDELLQSQNLYRYGEKLMEMNRAVSTDYGILYSPEGRTVDQCLARPGQHMQMGGQS